MDPDNDSALREQLLKRLNGVDARMSYEEAVRDFPMDRVNEKFPNGPYSAWGLLEHLRIAQHDILDYCTNPGYEHVRWPDDYWPDESHQATPEEWSASVEAFVRDKAALENLVRDAKTDLFAKIPWGGDHTILREITIVCDHNAYHIGEFAIMRQVMNTWGKRD